METELFYALPALNTSLYPAAITGKEHAKPNLPTHVIVND
jgi:hypothetical protein